MCSHPSFPEHHGNQKVEMAIIAGTAQSPVGILFFRTEHLSGSDSVGQSGVDQKLPEEAEADSESVKELVQGGSS